MGSSTVMMCSGWLVLMMSTIEARVVDLPDPVGPVTSTRPRGRLARPLTTAGTPSFSSGTIRYGMARSTAPTESRCTNTLSRNRPTLATGWDVSSSRSDSNFSRWRWVRME